MDYMYMKALAAQQGYKTLTVACLNIKTWNNQLNVKNLEKSTELSEFLNYTVYILKLTTSLGKKLWEICLSVPAVILRTPVFVSGVMMCTLNRSR